MILSELHEAKEPPRVRVATFLPEPLFAKTYSAMRNPIVDRRMGEFRVAKTHRPPEQLLGSFKDHHLKGILAGYQECHLDEDVCLIYTDRADVIRLLVCVSHDEMINKRAQALAKTLKRM